MSFKLRKLCSSIEDYEANGHGPLDLDTFDRYLSCMPGVEISRHGPVLTALFEDEGVVLRLFSSGKALIQASSRGDAERICSKLNGVADRATEEECL
jgi:hypothetical protein